MLRRTMPSRSSPLSVAVSDFWLTPYTRSNNREKRSGPSDVSSLNAQRLHTDGAEDRLSTRIGLSAVDILGSGELERAVWTVDHVPHGES